MNDYPDWWDATITVYSRIVDDETEETVYRQTVLDDCFWGDKNEGTKTEDGSVQIITSVQRIPDEALQGLSLKPDDIIVLGDMTSYWTHDSPIPQRDMKTIMDMFKQFGVPIGIVHSVKDNRRVSIGMPHISVRCRR